MASDALGIPDDRWRSTRLDFTVATHSGIAYDPATRQFDLSKAHFDFAPAKDRFWTYTVLIGPSKLVARSLTTTPEIPRAAERVTETIHGSVSVAVAGKTVTRSFARRIR